MSRATKLSEAHRKWIRTNPLRLWRLGRADHKVTQASVAIAARKSTQAIRDYESGSYTPDTDAMAVIAKLVGIKPENLEKRWTEWMSKRPRA